MTCLLLSLWAQGMTQKICLYQSIDGYCCDDLADNGEFCYWHNDQIIKNDKNLIEKLE